MSLIQMVVKIAVARGRALALVDNTGGSMVAISGCDADTARDYMDAVFSLAGTSEPESKRLYMATFNSPSDMGVSGSDLLIDLLASYIDNWVDGVVATKLRVSTAVHSPFVDACEKSYRSELATIFTQHVGPFIPSTLTMSTVTAEFKYDEYTVDYLWCNLRQPVLFSSAVPKIVDRFGENTIFLEVSPHPILSGVSSRSRDSPNLLTFDPSISRTWVHWTLWPEVCVPLRLGTSILLSNLLLRFTRFCKLLDGCSCVASTPYV
jgi:fatty acid synthase, animal type